MGGKRIRPVISLAVGEALETEVERILPAALSVELVHNFSLVHDDLPALDNDAERRGLPSVWAQFGEGRPSWPATHSSPRPSGSRPRTRPPTSCASWPSRPSG